MKRCEYDETAKEQRRMGGGGQVVQPYKLARHGQGADRENVKEDLLQYFQLVDKALHDFNRRASPMLAGVNYLPPIYHEANTTISSWKEDSTQHSSKRRKNFMQKLGRSWSRNLKQTSKSDRLLS